MKHLALILLIFTSFIMGAQNEYSPTDTINQLNKDGKKTGYWIITGNLSKEKGYADTARVREGYYKNNRKIGAWIKYWPNGELKSEIFYNNGRPSGLFSFYHPSGTLEEKGVFKGHYMGDYIRYYPSGCLQSKKYFGVTDVVVEYYKDDCNSNSIRGSCEIAFISFYSNHYTFRENVPSPLIYQTSFKTCDTCSLKTVLDTIEIIKIERRPTKLDSTINGNQTIFYVSGNLQFDGDFSKGELINGYYYLYDRKGYLIRKDTYEKYKFIKEEFIYESKKERRKRRKLLKKNKK